MLGRTLRAPDDAGRRPRRVQPGMGAVAVKETGRVEMSAGVEDTRGSMRPGEKESEWMNYPS